MMDKYELIDSMIVQINNSVGLLLSGQYIAWCDSQRDMVSKLAALKSGLMNEEKKAAMNNGGTSFHQTIYPGH